MIIVDEQFREATTQWDLNRLYKDLAFAKGDELTPIEKVHLRGLLCGCSPTDIAQQLHKSCKGVEVDLSRTVYQYVRNLLHNGEVKNWRNISKWLGQAGYKAMVTSVQLESSLPLNVQVKMVNITHMNQDETVLEFNVSVVIPSLLVKK